MRQILLACTQDGQACPQIRHTMRSQVIRLLNLKLKDIKIHCLNKFFSKHVNFDYSVTTTIRLKQRNKFVNLKTNRDFNAKFDNYFV
jgi:hypothetical protein